MKERKSTVTGKNQPRWEVKYDVEPIRIRDPVAEALAVLPPGEPFVISYEEFVKLAGHSCPTASGAYRITQLGLDSLYPDAYPVRSDIEVYVPGTKDDPMYGLMAHLISYVTGASEEDGFGGLAGGYGNRKNLLKFEAFETTNTSPTFRFRRKDTKETVEVTYHVDEVPDGGPAIGNLAKLIDGTASQSERDAFRKAWHGRVRAVLEDDSLFSVSKIDSKK